MLKGNHESQHVNSFESKPDGPSTFSRINDLALEQSGGRYSLHNWNAPVSNETRPVVNWLDNLTRKSKVVLEDEILVSEELPYTNKIVHDPKDLKYAGWGESNEPDHIKFRSMFLFPDFTPQTLTSRLKARAYSAGYYCKRSDGRIQSLFTMHSNRTGFLTSAILTSGLQDASKITDSMTRSAIIAAWKPGGAAQLRYLKDCLSLGLVSNRSQNMSTTTSANPISTAMLAPENFLRAKLQPNTFEYDKVNSEFFSTLINNECLNYDNGINGVSKINDPRMQISYLQKCNATIDVILSKHDLTKTDITRAIKRLEDEDNEMFERRSNSKRLQIAVGKAIGHLISEADNKHGGDAIIEQLRKDIFTDASLIAIIDKPFVWENPPTSTHWKGYGKNHTGIKILNGGGRIRPPGFESKSSRNISEVKGTLSSDGIRSFPKESAGKIFTKRLKWSIKEERILFENKIAGMSNVEIAKLEGMEARSNNDVSDKVKNLKRRHGDSCFSYKSKLAMELNVVKASSVVKSSIVKDRPKRIFPSSNILGLTSSDSSEIIDIDDDEDDVVSESYFDDENEKSETDEDDDDYIDEIKRTGDNESDDETEDETEDESDDETEDESDDETEDESNDEKANEPVKKKKRDSPLPSVFPSNSSAHQFREVKKLLKPKQATKRRKWDESENNAFRACLNTYGVGNWSVMLSSAEGEILRNNNRTGVNLKDRYKTVKDSWGI